LRIQLNNNDKSLLMNIEVPSYNKKIKNLITVKV